MLRKLFCWVVAESKHLPSPSLPSSPAAAEDVAPAEEPRDLDDASVTATWATLPADVLVEILLHLDPAAAFCCAGVCKPWRRAVVANASTLGFYPLLGVFHNSRHDACLRRTPPGPFHSVLRLPRKDDSGGGDDDDETAATAAHSLIPAACSWSGSAGGGGVYRGLYRELLCSRDGFILLMARSRNRHCRNTSLCICNPITDDCTFLRPANSGRRSSYVLLTGTGAIGGDDLWPPSGRSGSTGHDLVQARVLAVQTRARYDDLEFVFTFCRRGGAAEPLRYQVFSGSGDGGKWGPVKRSVGTVEACLYVWMRGRSTAVCRSDVVHCLAGLAPNITCALALDLRTGLTWTTAELPKQCQFSVRSPAEVVLATSDDGRRLSLIESLWGPKFNAWVLTGGDAGWTLQHTVESRRWPIAGDVPRWICVSAFCPRSRPVCGRRVVGVQPGVPHRPRERSGPTCQVHR